MRKGIAVPTILKLVIGVIVIVIVVFLIYRYVLKSPIGEQECRARMTAWCASCQLVDFSDGPKMGEELGSCVSSIGASGSTDQVCTGQETNCAGFLPSIE